jgi:hypothetical protein
MLAEDERGPYPGLLIHNERRNAEEPLRIGGVLGNEAGLNGGLTTDYGTGDPRTDGAAKPKGALLNYYDGFGVEKEVAARRQMENLGPLAFFKKDVESPRTTDGATLEELDNQLPILAAEYNRSKANWAAAGRNLRTRWELWAHGQAESAAGGGSQQSTFIARTEAYLEKKKSLYGQPNLQIMIVACQGGDNQFADILSQQPALVSRNANMVYYYDPGITFLPDKTHPDYRGMKRMGAAFHSFIAGLTPTIASFTPTTAAAGATLTISGTNLTADGELQVGGVLVTQATYRADGKQITLTVPDGVTSGNVQYGKNNVYAIRNGYFVAAPGVPTLSSFSPKTGLPGDSIQLTGSNFAPNMSASIGGQPAIISYISPTSATATVPQGAETGSVSVTTPAGTDSRTGFRKVLFIGQPVQFASLDADVQVTSEPRVETTSTNYNFGHAAQIAGTLPANQAGYIFADFALSIVPTGMLLISNVAGRVALTSSDADVYGDDGGITWNMARAGAGAIYSPNITLTPYAKIAIGRSPDMIKRAFYTANPDPNPDPNSADWIIIKDFGYDTSTQYFGLDIFGAPGCGVVRPRQVGLVI